MEIVGAYKLLHFVDVETGTPIASMPAHSMSIYTCDYHPTENVICSGGDDKALKVWDLNSGKCIQNLQTHSSWIWKLRFSPDGMYLGSASQDHTAKVPPACTLRAAAAVVGGSVVMGVAWVLMGCVMGADLRLACGSRAEYAEAQGDGVRPVVQ